MNQNDYIYLVATFIHGAVYSQLKEAKTLEDKFEVAFKEARHCFLSTDEDVRFRGGIGAVMLYFSEGSEEYDRITKELSCLKTIGAAFDGVSVNWDKLLSELPTEDFKPIGIVKLWFDSKEKLL